VTEFHATDFAANRGEYEDWKGDKIRRAIIKRDVNRLFMVSVEIDA